MFKHLLRDNNQLQIIYFELKVLEKYFNNPQYSIFYNDYSGTIYSKHEGLSNNLIIQHFGISYNKDTKKRAIGILSNILVDLPKKEQAYWYSYLLDNQDNYIINIGLYKNLILGEWIDEISIYVAILMEIHYINKMCGEMELPPMFKTEYPINTSNKDLRPSHYHVLLYPTRDNYYQFIITLEKLVVDNLNYKTFVETGIGVNSITREKENGEFKGTLILLEEWLSINIKNQDIDSLVIKDLKHLRKIRQKPAHQLYTNSYDEDFFDKQNSLVNSTYKSLRNIRLLITNHPYAKNIKIPKELYEGNKIIQY